MFNINKIKEALGIVQAAPQSVDSVLGKFTQTLADLDTVQATQAATSTQCTAEAAALVTKANEAEKEAKRAAKVALKISALLNADA